MSKPPDYFLVACPKAAPGTKSHGTRIGAAWRTGQGGRGISIRLNPGTALTWRDNEDLLLTLWPNEEKDAERETPPRGNDPPPFG
jgi:hypothetical protein